MVSDLKKLAYKGCKIARQNCFVFQRILSYYTNFFGIGATIRIGKEKLCLPCAGLFFFTLWVFRLETPPLTNWA